MENTLRTAGLTLVFIDQVIQPLRKGQRQNLAELLVATLEYDRSGEERRKLADKMIRAQIALARMGFSTGGRPPYGFRRWLAREDGTPVRELVAGERVRMAGHHVVWLPTAEEEFAVIRRILKMLETMPASRVVAALTKEGVPTRAAAGRTAASGTQSAETGTRRRSPTSPAIHCWLR